MGRRNGLFLLGYASRLLLLTFQAVDGCQAAMLAHGFQFLWLPCVKGILLTSRQVPVGMSTPWIHLNPKIFPDPLSFQPERFLDNPRLKRYLMSFSQGSRQCLGMQLAYAELHLVLSGVWRRFGGPPATDSGPIPQGYGGRMELFETDKRDIEMEYDLFVPYGKKDSQGIRIVIKKDS